MKNIKRRTKLFNLIQDNLSVISSWLIISLIIILFRNKISFFLANNSLIGENDVKESLFDLAFTILIVLISIRFLWFFIKNYRLSKRWNFIIFLVLVPYLALRNNSLDDLRFLIYIERLELLYADIIVLISFYALLLLVRNTIYPNWGFYDKTIKYLSEFKQKKNTVNEYSYLIEDIPIEGENKNDNEVVIDEIIKAINNLNPQNSFVIGINSIWGVGKTSFLKRIEYKLQNENPNEIKPIVFWFNAWQHQDEKSIISNFFNQLKKELSLYSGDSEKSIDNYLKELLVLADNKYLNFFKSIEENLFNSGSTIKDLYDDINEIIEKIDRKLFVFVDDIDRLNKAEILETLRILRNIAGFKNVIFICGFDRDYVINQSQIDNYYLDKIFNLEININSQNQKNTIVFLNGMIDESTGYDEEEKEELKKAFNTIFHSTEDDFDFIFDSLPSDVKNDRNQLELTSTPLIPSFFFETRRDVKRFFNELYINVKTLNGIKNINIEEYVLLRLLLFKYKWFHKNFAHKRIEHWLGNEDVLKFEETDLKKLLISNEIEQRDKIIVFSVLNNLFPKTGIINGSTNINQKRYFPIYFTNNVFNESFSFTELINSIKNSDIENLIRDKVIGKENENLIKNDIKTFVLKQENINSLDEYKQVISLIKNDMLGFVNEVEILDFVVFGEQRFKEEEILEMYDIMFTNFRDYFSSFLYRLNRFYSMNPKDISYSKNSFDNSENRLKIEGLKVINPSFLLRLLNKIIKKEIEKNNEDITKIVSYIGFFDEKYYFLFNFSLLYKDIQPIIKKNFKDKFLEIFLDKHPKQKLTEIDFLTIAQVFESQEERNKIIEQAENLIKNQKSWRDSDLNRRGYVTKGWDNFIEFVKEIKDDISEDNKEKYSDFLDWLYTYQNKGYIIPEEEDVKQFKQKEQ